MYLRSPNMRSAAERAAAARAAHEQNMFHDKQHGPKKRRRCCGGGCLKCVSYAFPWLHELLLHAEPASGKTPLMLTMAALRMTKRDAQPGRAKNHRASRFRRPEINAVSAEFRAKIVRSPIRGDGKKVGLFVATERRSFFFSPDRAWAHFGPRRRPADEPPRSRFLQLFERIDFDHSGTIDIEEFFGYVRMDVSGYSRKAFAMMEIKHEFMGRRPAWNSTHRASARRSSRAGDDGRVDPQKVREAQSRER